MGNENIEENKKQKTMLSIFYIFFVVVIVFFIYYNYINKNNNQSVLESTVELKYGESYKIDLNKKNEKNEEIEWTSSDPELAIVDGNGNLSIINNSDGTVIITATTKNNEIVANITVEIQKIEDVVHVTGILIDKSEITLNYGETSKLTATVSPSKATNKTITWTSSDSKLVSVDKKGNIKAVGNKDGTATIIVKTADGGYTASVKVTVKSIKVTGIKLDKSAVTLKYGETATLKATVSPSNAANKTVTWTSSNPELVSVDSLGTISIPNNKSGEAIITAKTADGGYTVSVKVKAQKVTKVAQVTGVKLNKSEIILNYGETAKITATISPSNATNKTITWTNSNSNLVSIDSNGNIKAVGNKDGTVTITVKTADGGYTASVKVTVKSIKVTGIKLDKSAVTLKYGETATLKATVSPSNAANKTVTWTSSNTKVATVNNGVVTAKGVGTTIITAASNGKTATAKITVTSQVIPVSSISLNKTSETIYLNSGKTSITLTATISPTNATNKNVTWTSSNKNVATVNNGVVTIKGLGTTNIKVTTKDGNYSATYKLNIKEKVILVITASAGKRMNDWFESYTSSKGNYYSKAKNNLKYIYKSGSGFSYQYEEGLTNAINYINNLYSNNKNYIELSIFFILTGNSVRNYTCDEIQSNKNGLYTDIAEKYNTAIQKVINLGYKNTKGYVISHSPLNTKQAIQELKKSGFAYSHTPEACKSGYRSAWKYWISNRKFESILNSGKYSNLTFVDNYSNFVILKDETARTFTWLRDYYRTTDGLHWDERTTKDYMQLAFDSANM